MRKVLQGLVAVMVLAAGSSAFAGDENGKAERSLKLAINGRVPGQPIACIYPSQIGSTEIIDGTAIVYRMVNGKVYVNYPRVGAHNLEHNAVIRMGSTVRPLCYNDFVTLYDNGGTTYGVTASVAMGPFVPYVVAER